LVPFGEFVPLRWMLPAAWLTPVGAKDFSSGPGSQTLTWPGLPPLSPLICYEAIFPELAVDRENRPQMLLNVTNDAWFGFSSGPHQHFHMARTRAVEQGLPLVRVANTGITAIVDGYGRVLDRMGLGEKGIIDTPLPVALPPTLYGQYWDSFLLFLVFAGVILIIRSRRHSKN
jgi:apolipoprotein N-acyltransferase